MSQISYSKKIYQAYLSDEKSVFPNIYEAVSEQILLLIFKARQLNLHPVYNNWFAEQHLVLNKLRTQKDKIKEIYSQGNKSLYFVEKLQDDLLDALIYMKYFYEGFDEGKVSLKTWREMHHVSIKINGRVQNNIELEEKFVSDEIFAILTESQVCCSAIPLSDRKGYCHQDLSIAHSCSNELIMRLNDYNKIDSLYIIAETIFDFIQSYNEIRTPLPAWLTLFEGVDTSIYYNSNKRESLGFKKIIGLINLNSRKKVIEDIIDQCTDHDAQNICNHYAGIFASDILEWLSNILIYLKPSDSTSYNWKFTTITPDSVSTEKSIDTPESSAWDSDYCQISIRRENLLELIHSHALHDATNSLANSLLRIYQEQAYHHKDTIPIITDNERKVQQCSSNSTFQFFDGRNYSESINSVQTFESWYRSNKVILVSKKNTRTEKISVVARLAGLKVYDLKMGIPNGCRMRIKDGLYKKVKQDSSLPPLSANSDISLQRNHKQVREIISDEIDVMLQKQREKNEKSPYSGAIHTIKPFWGKCKSINDA